MAGGGGGGLATLEVPGLVIVVPGLVIVVPGLIIVVPGLITLAVPGLGLPNKKPKKPPFLA